MSSIARVNFTDNSLIQEVVFDRQGEEVESCLISGAEAIAVLNDIVWATSAPLIMNKNMIIGYIDSMGNRVEYWDCEEQTYSEYVAENKLFASV